MEKLIKFEIGKSAKERSLSLTFGECQAELHFQGKLRGRDVLAFDCFTETLAYQKAEAKKGHALFNGASPYGSTKAEVFFQNASTLKIKASITLRNQVHLCPSEHFHVGRGGKSVL